jgi:predicted nucleic acid-binding protein
VSELVLDAYDALYLELALRKRRPLGTTDALLASVARKSGVKLAFDQD